MPALLDSPEFQEAFASADDVSSAVDRWDRDWEIWCSETDAILGTAIELSQDWKTAALLADSHKQQGTIDLWAFGDAVFPAVTRLKHVFEKIDQRLEVSVPQCPLSNYNGYLEARRDMLKTVDYFSRWPRTNRTREDHAMAEYEAGLSTRFAEIADDMCH